MSRLRSLLFAPLGGLLDLLLPPTCSLCDQLLDEPRAPVCPECRASFEPLPRSICPSCGRPVGQPDAPCAECRCALPPLAPVRSAFLYGGAAQQAILRLKLAGRRELADWLVSELLAADLSGWDWGPVDLLAPVPLHSSRLMLRGFNQAALVARSLGRRIGKPVCLDGLVRRRASRAQGLSRSRAERFANVRGAFSARASHPFRGRRVCLVDDVVTTGATLTECARTLLQAGALSVCALTVARAEPM